MQVGAPGIVVALRGRGWRLAGTGRAPHHMRCGQSTAQRRRGPRCTVQCCRVPPAEHLQSPERNVAGLVGYGVETQHPTLRIRKDAVRTTADRLGRNETTLGLWYAPRALKNSIATGVGLTDAQLLRLRDRRNAARPLGEP